jgi:hypothetical protein
MIKTTTTWSPGREDVMTERFEKIATIRNEVEAICLREELEERGIPHAIQSYYDLAYDGLFQPARGWGHVAAPVERTDEILAILELIRRQAAQRKDQAEPEDNEPGG